MAEVGYTKTVNFKYADEEIRILASKIEKWGKELQNNITDELIIGVNQIRNIIITSMQGTKRANWFYMRGGKKHFPSAPGNPPAIDTGELIRSIVMDVRKLEVEIGATTGAPYAKALETGTSKMKSRPWLAPVVDQEIGGITGRILNRLQQEFQ